MVDYFTPICNVCIVRPRHLTIHPIDQTTSYVCQKIYLHNVFDYSLTKLFYDVTAQYSGFLHKDKSAH